MPQAPQAKERHKWQSVIYGVRGIFRLVAFVAFFGSWHLWGSMWLAEYFHHCPKCGSPELKSKKGKTFDCTDCGFHFYLNPAAAAAGLLLCERRPSEVLFIKRAKEPKKGRLALVGGFVDQGEALEETLAREVREELGVELGELIYHASFPNEYVFQGVRYPVTDSFFRAYVRQENFRVDEAEVGEVVWRDVRTLDLDELAFTSMQRAVAKYRDALEGRPEERLQ